MGALYVMVGIGSAGLVLDLLTTAFGDGNAETYDYHFVPGVGAVFGATK